MFKLKSEVQSIWVLKNPTKQTSLIEKNGSVAPRQIRISLDEVRYCTTKGVAKHYIKIVTLSGKMYYKLSTLDTIARHCSFITHITRDTIVNIHSIDKRHDWLFIWSNEAHWKVSPVYKQELIELLEYNCI